MNLKTLKYLALAVPFIIASCAREADIPDDNTAPVAVETPTGRPVTISAGLPAQTRVAHELSETSIHPTWEVGDQVTVTFTKDGSTVTETFTLQSGEGTQSAKFYNEESQLGDNTPFTVEYIDKNNPDGWAEQKGTLECLPECLSATVSKLSESATLEPALTYFRVVTTIPSGTAYTYAYLSRLEGGFTMYSSPGTKGAVTVKPDGGFSGSVDFYIAVKLVGNTSQSGSDIFSQDVSPKFQIEFGDSVQGISADGQAFQAIADESGDTYKYSWSPAKDYVAGKVYRIADKTFTSVTAAHAMPR